MPRKILRDQMKLFHDALFGIELFGSIG